VENLKTLTRKAKVGDYAEVMLAGNMNIGFEYSVDIDQLTPTSSVSGKLNNFKRGDKPTNSRSAIVAAVA